jgi:hypothetical protein
MGNCFKTREIDMVEVFINAVDKYENNKLLSDDDIKIDNYMAYNSSTPDKKIKGRKVYMYTL